MISSLLLKCNYKSLNTLGQTCSGRCWLWGGSTYSPPWKTIFVMVTVSWRLEKQKVLLSHLFPKGFQKQALKPSPLGSQEKECRLSPSKQIYFLFGVAAMFSVSLEVAANDHNKKTYANKAKLPSSHLWFSWNAVPFSQALNYCGYRFPCLTLPPRACLFLTSLLEA